MGAGLAGVVEVVGLRDGEEVVLGRGPFIMRTVGLCRDPTAGTAVPPRPGQAARRSIRRTGGRSAARWPGGPQSRRVAVSGHQSDEQSSQWQEQSAPSIGQSSSQAW